MNNETRIKIISIKEKIQDLTEYLQSDICRGCGDAALKIDKYIGELAELIGVDDKDKY
jgi:ubiquinone/menaquinone biosynthesis C-methylase UbiE